LDLNTPKLIDDAVCEFSKLPGIGKKTALRLVLYLLKQPIEKVNNFGTTFIKMRENIHFCEVCNNISDTKICNICSSFKREKSTICVIADIRDIIAIENTSQYNGVYHVLGGIISPMDGIGPQNLHIDSLIKRVQGGEINEVILALSSTMEGEMTSNYIYKKLKEFDINISVIARGIAIGDELEYADEVTLGQSILNRLPFNKNEVKTIY